MQNMKRPLFFFLSLLFSLFLSAQEASVGPNRFYFKIGSTADLSSVPLELHLDNSDGSITAVEVYLTLPDGSATFGDSFLGLDVCSSDHALVSGLVDGSLFVSVASPSLAPFALSDSPLCTILCDLSSLGDGVHRLTSHGSFAVGVSGDSVLCYTSSDVVEELTIVNGTTSIDATTLHDSRDTGIYDLRGIRLSSPRKGSINIINGKKVKL